MIQALIYIALSGGCLQAPKADHQVKCTGMNKRKKAVFTPILLRKGVIDTRESLGRGNTFKNVVERLESKFEKNVFSFLKGDFFKKKKKRTCFGVLTGTHLTPYSL